MMRSGNLLFSLGGGAFAAALLGCHGAPGAPFPPPAAGVAPVSSIGVAAAAPTAWSALSGAERMASLKRRVLQAAGGEAQVEFWGLNVNINLSRDGCDVGSHQFSGSGTVTPLNPYYQRQSWCANNYTTRFAYRVPDGRYLVINYVDVGTSTWNNLGNGTAQMSINNVAVQAVRLFSSSAGLGASAQAVRFYFGPGQLVVFSVPTSNYTSVAGYLADGAFLLGSGGAGGGAAGK